MREKVGACLVVGKSILKGYNKPKTHTDYANPNEHVRLSLHAELDCINKAEFTEGGEIYVYREVHGQPSLSRPCDHCMKFLKDAGIKAVYYSTPRFPYWRKEII
jgi:deoxycytidylate deaminase